MSWSYRYHTSVSNVQDLVASTIGLESFASSVSRQTDDKGHLMQNKEHQTSSSICVNILHLVVLRNETSPRFSKYFGMMFTATSVEVYFFLML